MGSRPIGPISPIGRIRAGSIAAAEKVVIGAQRPQFENEDDEEDDDEDEYDYGGSDTPARSH